MDDPSLCLTSGFIGDIDMLSDDCATFLKDNFQKVNEPAAFSEVPAPQWHKRVQTRFVASDVAGSLSGRPGVQQ